LDEDVKPGMIEEDKIKILNGLSVVDSNKESQLT